MAVPTFDGGSCDFGFANTITDGFFAHNRVIIGPVESAKTRFSFPGVDGEFSGNMGKRGRTIIIDMTAISTSEAYMNTMEAGVEAYVNGGPFTLTAHGRTFANTELVGFDCTGYREPLHAPHAYIKTFRVTFRQYIT